jgi:hypothetical protein
MANKKHNNKGSNAGLLVALGVVGIGTVGAVAWSRGRSSEAAAKPSAGVVPGSHALTGTLAENATTLRHEVLIVDGCTVSWRVGEASRTTLLGHRDDFLVPAIADAQSRGATTVDEITARVAALLVPSCAWPPPILENFDLDAAIGDEMTFLQKQAWTIAQTSGAVQLYLTLRMVVATLVGQGRRG